MTDEFEPQHEIQQLRAQGDASSALSKARSGMVARGRKDANELMAPRLAPKPSKTRSWKKVSYMAIALKHYRGEGVPQDYAKAAYWFGQIAYLGHAGAQNGLGLLYARGHGVPQDYAEAFFWLKLAAKRERSKDREVFAMDCDAVAAKLSRVQR